MHIECFFHILPTLHSFTWLLVCERIHFNVALLMYLTHSNHLPSYLFVIVASYSSVSCRSSLLSASAGKYRVPSTRLVLGRHSFTFAGPPSGISVFETLLLRMSLPLTENLPLSVNLYLLRFAGLQCIPLNLVRSELVSNCILFYPVLYSNILYCIFQMIGH